MRKTLKLIYIDSGVLQKNVSSQVYQLNKKGTQNKVYQWYQEKFELLEKRHARVDDN